MNISIQLVFIALLIEILISCSVLKNNRINRDLLFFLITNFILSISLLIFFNYYKDLFLTFINCLFLFLNTIFLIFEVKNIMGKYGVFTLPYFGIIMFIFCFVIDYCLFR